MAELTFEERKQRRQEEAGQAGARVIRPNSNVTHGMLSNIGAIDRAIGRLQANAFQPGKSPTQIEEAKIIVDELYAKIERSAEMLSELAGINYRRVEI